MRQAPESWFLATLLTRLTVTIGGLKTDSLVRLHELLDCEASGRDGDASYPPEHDDWRQTVALVEEELARRGVAVRAIRTDELEVAEHA